jgi:DMSO/TMAO reductase YedYZ molybdopterin-dependent catalytic subunit
MALDQPVFDLRELQLATRNHGVPLEALRYPITPVGLHYLLIHFDIPAVDPDRWRLEMGGSFTNPFSLSLDDLRARPQVSVPVTMECAGNGRAGVHPHVVSQPWLLEAVGTAEWSGTPLRGLLEEAGLAEEAVEVVFEGLDRGVDGGVEQAYARSLTIEQAMADDALLAHSANGAPLPPQHGFPLRLVVPGWYGMTSVKWLHRITAVAEPFDGYQQAQAYRMRQSENDEGEPVTRIMPRALMVPPGIPDFLTRERLVDGGPVQLEGRAWSGRGEIVGVEVSADGGSSWDEAELAESTGRHAWRGWSYLWQPAGPGSYELCCAARDSAGNRQPLEAAWNVGGYANNAVQRVAVTVR